MSAPAESPAVVPADDTVAPADDLVAIRTDPGLPKVLLHDHLDGGLRPQSIIEMAAEVGPRAARRPTPTRSARWFYEAASSGTLPRYLETFDHTIAVMQTEEHLRRVARESAIDLAADGVVYAEQRYAPEQHLQQGLSLQEVVDAVQAGFAEGVAEAAAQGHSIRIGTLVTAMRHADRWDEIAELTLANRDNGVVGLRHRGRRGRVPAVAAHLGVPHAAGRQLPGHRARGRGRGLRLARRGGAPRAGGPDRARRAARSRTCPPTSWATRLGLLAHWVRDRRIPLELCPSSNLQTGGAPVDRRAPGDPAQAARVRGHREHRQPAAVAAPR